VTADAPSPAGEGGGIGGAAPPIVVAIDGPAGVGKSAVARDLARELGLTYLDTGAMYRAMGWKALRQGVRPDSVDDVARLAGGAALELRPRADGGVDMRLDGEPVEPHIRAPEVGEMASRLATQPAVRNRLVELQRAFGNAYGAVMEGRDIGTVVFPQTPYKFFLDAAPPVRVRRRRDQLRAAGREASDADVEAELLARDRRDRERAHSPLAWDPSYERVDTSAMTLAEVVSHLVAAVAARSGGHAL
jgi:cytidylate kinase